MVLWTKMERIANKAHGFDDAKRWDIAQSAAMTPDERRRVAKALRDRYFGTSCPDVRDAVAGARLTPRKRT
jgi:hypothetical protein